MFNLCHSYYSDAASAADIAAPDSIK